MKIVENQEFIFLALQKIILPWPHKRANLKKENVTMEMVVINT